MQKITSSIVYSINWIAFKNLIIIAVKVWKAMDYLDKTIKDSSILIKSPDNSDSKLKPILFNIIP